MNSDQWDWVHRTLSSAAAWLLHTKAALLSGMRSVCSYQPRKSTNEADRLTVTFGNVLYKSPLTNSFETTCKTKSFLYLSVVTYYLDFSPWVNFQCRLPYSVCIAPVCTHACMHAHTNNTRVHTHNMLLVHHTHTHTQRKKLGAVSHVWTIFDPNLVTEIVFSHGDFLIQTRRCVNMHHQVPYHQYIPLGPPVIATQTVPCWCRSFPLQAWYLWTWNTQESAGSVAPVVRWLPNHDATHHHQEHDPEEHGQGE